MKEFIEKLISRLEKYQGKLKIKCGNRGTFDFMEVDAVKEIVNQLAEEYKTCYKSCSECEAYDKEKHYCPKFCYIIEETVKEIEENHKGGWIACSERLPEQSGRYIVTIKNATKATTLHYFEGSWHDGICYHYEVIAWQPLPPVYKGE